MPLATPHTFHVPVMGLAFTIDTPLKVARFGIPSVVSLSDDALIEQMRQHYSQQHHRPFTPIADREADYRARRITAYLNLLDALVTEQMLALQNQDFGPGTDLTRYFNLLPDESPLKARYRQMQQATDPGGQQRL